MLDDQARKIQEEKTVKFPYLKRYGAKMVQITKEETLTDSL